MNRGSRLTTTLTGAVTAAGDLSRKSVVTAGTETETLPWIGRMSTQLPDPLRR